MPVTLQKVSEIMGEHRIAVERIAKDLSEDHPLQRAIEQWTLSNTASTLYFGVFNDRPVGFVLIEGSDIKGFGVHPSTRHRGVGLRMLELLMNAKPALAWVDHEIGAPGVELLKRAKQLST